MTEYVLQDRLTGAKYAIRFIDGQLNYVPTTAEPSEEPIVRDKLDTSLYWKIYIEDQQMQAEPGGAFEDDEVVIEDLVSGVNYLLGVWDSQPGYIETEVEEAPWIPIDPEHVCIWTDESTPESCGSWSEEIPSCESGWNNELSCS